jgi:hypothetical protein
VAFVQVIAYHTSRQAEMEALTDEWEKATEGRRTARRRLLFQDRDDTDRYFNLVFFDSFEEAMQNSAMPETKAFAQRMASLADEPATFYNLDLVDDRL